MHESSRPPAHDQLVRLTTEILDETVALERTLVAQGLDSVGAAELLEALDEHGFDADYEDLLDEATIGSIAASLRKKSEDGPTPSPKNLGNTPVALTGPQVIWANLDKQG